MSRTIVKVGMASCGIAAGGGPVFEKLHSLLDSREDVEVKKVGCIGFCYKEPLVEIEKDGVCVTYGEVDSALAEEIVAKHIDQGEILKEHVVLNNSGDAPENPRLENQVRIVLRNTGLIDPENIDEYIARQGYHGLEKALKEMTPMQVIQEILDSGLRGRGGAGFPTGLKWKFAHLAKADKKYFVCNADEGDPGAFMDRSVLEGDPHSVLEGMAVGAYAIGADEGIIYCRAEYPLAIKHLNTALEQARERGFLGENIMGTGFNFDIHIKEGAR
ncbi:MAG TPA: NADH-quinone oxidoreductase subunit F, partial [Synergistales bacterium]|nr:NADH-quinone oxidoreductase subunit F [Synergistales bacterium]